MLSLRTRGNAQGSQQPDATAGDSQHIRHNSTKLPARAAHVAAAGGQAKVGSHAHLRCCRHAVAGHAVKFSCARHERGRSLCCARHTTHDGGGQVSGRVGYGGRDEANCARTEHARAQATAPILSGDGKESRWRIVSAHPNGEASQIAPRAKSSLLRQVSGWGASAATPVNLARPR